MGFKVMNNSLENRNIFTENLDLCSRGGFHERDFYIPLPEIQTTLMNFDVTGG